MIEIEKAPRRVLWSTAYIPTPQGAWAKWAGWVLRVGCNRCTTYGQNFLKSGDREPRYGETAPCYGVAACHGYENGCGCAACNLEDRKLDLAEAEQKAAAVEIWRFSTIEARKTAMREELARLEAEGGA